MSHVVPSIIASEFPLPPLRISDYVNASGRGLSGTWDSIKTGVLHPLNSIGNTLQMSWDGYNAYADLVFGISTQGSRERNLARGIEINNAIDRVINGNGVTRTEVATQVVSTVVASVLMGKVVGNVVSGIKGISTSGFFRGESALTNTVESFSTKAAYNGELYPTDKLNQLVKYLERRGISVFGADRNPAFVARSDGTGMMLLPENPTILQVKHELSHYLDFKKLGYDNYVGLGRTNREALVLERLQNNRVWEQLNTEEKQFSIDYVNRLMDSENRYTK